ncbi:MAG: hypothetical protein RIS35_1500 [Pseudomonadota bacterium]
MPTYDYACASCGGFEAFRSLSERSLPVDCPECGTAAQRVIVAAPNLSALATGTRRAIEANERSANAPMSSKDYAAGGYARLRHPSGCGCCSSASKGRGATVRAPNGAKAFPSKRPWMISH